MQNQQAKIAIRDRNEFIHCNNGYKNPKYQPFARI